MRILVVEDEAELARFVARGLRQAGLAVDLAGDGETALEKAIATDYDVVVLDRGLPGISGDEVCRQLVASSPAPKVLMLTARGDVSSRVAGLALGADDYMPKPFAMEELIARIRALGRRSAAVLPAVMTIGELSVDPARFIATRNGAPVPLNRKEFGVLETLAAADGRVVSAEELLERVWDEEIDPFSNIIRVTMMNLRRKLGEPPLIETVVGVGYRLKVPGG